MLQESMSDDEEVPGEVDALRDFCSLRTRDTNNRLQFLDSVIGIVKDWTSQNQDNGVQKRLEESLPCILRLSKRCPFPDVRDKCTEVLKIVKAKGFKTPRRLQAGPSCFLPSREFSQRYSGGQETPHLLINFLAWSKAVSMDTDDEQTHSVLVESFLFSGRVTNIISLLAFHPQYLECFVRTQYFMMRGEGPLPFNWRNFLAILAAARHQCSYLVNLYEREFLVHHGDPEWLKGINHIPKKLHAILEINKFLAHQPWLVTKEHIAKLLKGEDNWSLSELVHALVILTHFHALSCFVYGTGITPEIDFDCGHTFRPPSQDSFDVPDPPASDQNSRSTMNGSLKSKDTTRSSITGQELMERMRQLQAEHDALKETSQEELFEQFECVEKGELATCTDAATAETDMPKPHMARYLEDPHFRYKDFAQRDEQGISTFRAQDYSWEEHGFSLVNRLYSDIGPLLDEKFATAINLTYFTLGSEKNVDTTMFRSATWNYIHLVMGIYHDDYLYTEVNKLMERSYKKYIKTVTCYPERTTQADYLEFMPELTHSEKYLDRGALFSRAVLNGALFRAIYNQKVHINVLLLEAHMQAELLYALKAVMRYMT